LSVGICTFCHWLCLFARNAHGSSNSTATATSAAAIGRRHLLPQDIITNLHPGLLLLPVSQAAGRPQLGGHLQRLLQRLADSNDTVATSGRSHRMMLLGAVAKGGGLLESLLEFVLAA
jgi:hypothetical protein